MGDEIVKTTIGGVVVGALSGTISGAVGSGIMIAANHTGYNVLEAVEMGATGGGIFLGGAACIGSLTSLSFFSQKGMAAGMSGFVLNCFLSGIIGYAVLHEGAHVVAMEFYETAIAFLVGAAVFSGSTSVTAGLVALCCGAVVGCAFFNKFSQENEDDQVLESGPSVKDYGSFQHNNVHVDPRRLMKAKFPSVSIEGMPNGFRSW